MTAKKDAPGRKAKKPKIDKETVKDLGPKDAEVKGGTMAATRYVISRVVRVC